MLDNKIILILLATLSAAIPVVIWIVLFLRQSNTSKKLLALIFFAGTLVAPLMLGIQYFWTIFPQANLETLVTSSISDSNLMFGALFVLFGAMEEIFKHFAVRSIDKRTVAIQTVNDSLKLSILAALGFSFAENIYYMVSLFDSLTAVELIGMYIARSGITMLGHIIFSGIFGYYFGISKFAIDMTNEQKMLGKKSLAASIISKLFNVPLAEGFKEKTILKGLTLAILFHATFNFLLHYDQIIPVIIIVALGYLFLRFLLQRKVGHLVMITDVSTKRASVMPKKDEDVVVELISMWFNDKRYVDVVHICERLLERDPDNNVIKLFKAQALDKLEGTDSVHAKIITSLFKSKDDLSKYDRSILNKHLEQNS